MTIMKEKVTDCPLEWT